MGQIIINTGNVANDGLGTPLRNAFDQVNYNFTQLFNAGPSGSNIVIANNSITVTNTKGNLRLATNGIGSIVPAANFVPDIPNVRSLGAGTNRFNTVYAQYINANTGTFAGNVYVAGNLQVTGNVVTVDYSNLSVANSNITLSTGAANAAQADGGGVLIPIAGANLTYNYSANSWNSTIAVTAPTFIGDGANLTNVIANVQANALLGNTFSNSINYSNLTSFGLVSALSATGNISAVGNVYANAVVGNRITANYLYGNGSNITNITANAIVGNVPFALVANTAYVANLAALATQAINADTALFAINANLASWANTATIAQTANAATYAVQADNANSAVVAGMAYQLAPTANLSVTGNITTGGYFIGDGGLISNILVSTTYSNSNVSSYLQNLTSNVSTTGNITADGNITGGNILTGEQIIANGEIQSGTGLFTGGYLSVNGSSDLADVNVSGNLSAVGNILSNSLTTTGVVYAGTDGQLTTSNSMTFADVGGEMTLTVDYFSTSTVFTNDILGSGNSINVSAQYGNSVLFDTTGGISATGDVTANAFIGDGSQLTNIPAAGISGQIQINWLGSFSNQGGTPGDTYSTLQFDSNGMPTLDGTTAYQQRVDYSPYLQVLAPRVESTDFGIVAGPGITVVGYDDNYNTPRSAYLSVQDQANATQQWDFGILGNGDNNFVVSDRTNSNQWTFGTSGNLTLPGNTSSINYANGSPYGGNANTGNITFNGDEIGSTNDTVNIVGNNYAQLQSANTYMWVEDGEADIQVNGNTWVFNDSGYMEIPNEGSFGALNSSILAFSSQNNKPIFIEVIDTGNSAARQWVFDNSGNLTLPNGAIIKDTVAAAVAFGDGAGANTQGAYSVAVGSGAGANTQGDYAVAVGSDAGANTQGNLAVAIGYNAGNATQGIQAVAVGAGAGQNTQGNSAVAIGYSAGVDTQGEASIAIGQNAGNTTQGNSAVAIGQYAGQTGQGNEAVAIGDSAGQTGQHEDAVAIGQNAGQTGQGISSVAIGYGAGFTDQGNQSVAIGENAGANQGSTAVAIGQNAGGGVAYQNDDAVAIGHGAGEEDQGTEAVALGLYAGQTTQGIRAVAIGKEAGQISQGFISIAIGGGAGGNTQGNASIAIGADAGHGTQGANAIAIGFKAGDSAQGTESIAIGKQAGYTNQANNSIILNATGSALDQTTANTFTVKPIRSTTTGNVLYYDETSGEITFGVGGGAGNTGNVTFDNNTVIGTGDQYGGSGLYLAPGLESPGNLQYLRVRGGDYPTHIHLDTGNNQYFDQYFGADGKFVKLEANGNIVINADDYVGNAASWTFGADSNLIAPGNINFTNNAAIQINPVTGVTIYGNSIDQATALNLNDVGDAALYANANVTINSNSQDSNPQWVFDTTGKLNVPGAIRTASNSQLELTESANTAYLGTTADDSTALYLTATTAQLYANGEVSISSNVGGGNAHGWAFDVDGNTNIPGDIISFGNIGITTNVGNTTSSWTFGTDGTTQFPANTINTAGQLSIKSFDSLLDISSANTTVGSGGEILLNSGFTGPSSAGVQLVAYVDGTQAALKTWNFGADGNLHTPQGGYIGPADVKGQGTMLSGGTGNITSVTSYYADAPGIYSSCLTANPDGTLNISTYGNGTGLLGQWIFGDGNLTVLGNFNAATASPAPSINGFDSINAITFSASGNVTANIFNLGNAGNLTYSSIQQNQNPPYGSEAYGIELLTTTDDANVFSSISAGPDYVSLKSTNAGNANVVLQGGYGITLSTSNATGGAIKNWTFTAAGEALYPGNISTSGNVYATNIVAEASFNIQSSNFNAIVGNRYGVDTTSNPVTATLTAFPITGTAVFFADAGGAFATNNFTINPVGRTIMGSSGNYVVNTNNNSFGLFWNGTTWRTYSNV